MMAISSKDISKFNPRRFFALGGISVVLCALLAPGSFMAPFAILTPLPLIISSLLYGRAKTFGLILISGGVLGLLSVELIRDISPLGYFLFSAIIAIALSEFIHREIAPIRGIVVTGIAALIFFATVFLYVDMTSEAGIKQLIIKEVIPSFNMEERLEEIKASGRTDTLQFEALLSKPDLMAEEIIKTIPTLLSVAVFLTLWINMFFALRLRRVLTPFSQGKRYTEKVLTNFKMPDQFVWLVIVLLTTYLGAEYEVTGLLSGSVGTVAQTGLFVLGIFYFFHGFGIYLYFLDAMKIYGFFRSFLVVTTVFMLSWGVAVIGLIDTFVDFKNLLNKKNQGE